MQFIRYPIDVNLFENNLEKYKSNINRINLTVQILNIFDLDIIKNYYNDFDVSTESYVGYPKFLSVRNLSDKYKKEVINNYSNYEDRNKIFFTEINSNSDSFLITLSSEGLLLKNSNHILGFNFTG